MTAASRSPRAVLAALEADGILTVDDRPGQVLGILQALDDIDAARARKAREARDPDVALGHCGGCAGSGSIVNPNTGRPEPHLACAGRGLR
jgi:alkanesulfonate monooxygenase SsuD/methylene tetrahydromethanopterin reductase-like flavin-dependent oxidoreductase (luciferase family)